MKGENEIKLNTASVMEAIQMWLDAQFVAGRSPVVTAFSVEDKYDGTYTVKVEERKPEQK